jgi:hypothetical protein
MVLNVRSKLSFMTTRHALARTGLLCFLVGATPALAAGSGKWLVTGDLARACSITFDCQTSDRCIQLRLDDRSTPQSTAVITWQCNYAIDSATMEFASQNQGFLRNDADTVGLPYRASYTGGQNSGFSDRTLITPFVSRPTPDTPNVDVTGTLQLTIGVRSDALLAGRYSDRITVTITPDGQ